MSTTRFIQLFFWSSSLTLFWRKKKWRLLDMEIQCWKRNMKISRFYPINMRVLWISFSFFPSSSSTLFFLSSILTNLNTRSYYTLIDDSILYTRSCKVRTCTFSYNAILHIHYVTVKLCFKHSFLINLYAPRSNSVWLLICTKKRIIAKNEKKKLKIFAKYVPVG